MRGSGRPHPGSHEIGEETLSQSSVGETWERRGRDVEHGADALRGGVGEIYGVCVSDCESSHGAVLHWADILFAALHALSATQRGGQERESSSPACCDARGGRGNV